MMAASVSLGSGVGATSITIAVAMPAPTACRPLSSLATVKAATIGPTADRAYPDMKPLEKKKHADTIASVGHGAARRNARGNVVNASAA